MPERKRRAAGMLAAASLVCGLLAGSATGAGAAPVENFFSEPLPAGATPVAPLATTAAQAQLAASPIACEGDGVSGKRVKVFYVREADQPDRYAKVVPSLQAYAAGVDDAYNDSAADTGGSRHIRYVTTAGDKCKLDVGNLVLPKGGYAHIFDAAAQADGNNKDRDYVLFSDNAATCGGTQGDNDDQPGPANRFNNGWHWTEIGVNCWGANAMAHELGHMLGAVLPGAPHFQGGGHCSQEWDIMCYGDTQDYTACPERDKDRLMDCGHDDYYSTNPKAGSWLATHWNVANSAFLIKKDTPDNDDGHAQGGKTYVITGASGRAIDVIGSSTGGLVKLSTRAKNDSLSQKWVLYYETGLQLVNANSQLCADSAQSGTAPGTQILQYNCNGQNGMRWAFQSLGNGKVAIFNYLTGYAITEGGSYPAPLVQQPYTGAANQQWKLSPVADAGPKDGKKYYLANTSNGNSASVVNGSTSSGALLDNTGRQDDASQKWKLVAAGAYWRIENDKSGRCMRPVGGSKKDGAQLEQADCGSSSNQQWKLVKTADMMYGLVNRDSGLAVRQVNNGTASVLEQRPFLGGTSHETVWALIPS